jgi:hypothetical protein
MGALVPVRAPRHEPVDEARRTGVMSPSSRAIASAAETMRLCAGDAAPIGRRVKSFRMHPPSGYGIAHKAMTAGAFAEHSSRVRGRSRPYAS